MLCNGQWISPCCKLVFEFTMLCNCLRILPSCEIVCEFYHVMFVNFTICFNIICWFHNAVQWLHHVVQWLIVVGVLFGCCWGVVGVLILEWGVLFNNNPYQLTNWTISRVATATKNRNINFAQFAANQMRTEWFFNRESESITALHFLLFCRF